MPGSAGSDAPRILHHAIIRGIERQYIFQDKTDKEVFVNRLSKLVPQYPASLVQTPADSHLPSAVIYGSVILAAPGFRYRGLSPHKIISMPGVHNHLQADRVGFRRSI